MRRLALFFFTTTVVLMSIALVSTAYRDGRLSRLAAFDRRERFAGVRTETTSAGGVI